MAGGLDELRLDAADMDVDATDVQVVVDDEAAADGSPQTCVFGCGLQNGDPDPSKQVPSALCISKGNSSGDHVVKMLTYSSGRVSFGCAGGTSCCWSWPPCSSNSSCRTSCR